MSAISTARTTPVTDLLANYSGFSLAIRRGAATSLDVSLLTLFFFGGGFAIAPIQHGALHTAALVALATAIFAYYPVTEGRWGVTAGKWLTGLAVVDDAGHPPGLWRALIRMLTRLVEVIPVSGLIAGVSVIATQHKQRLGDLLARTYVIPIRPLRAWRKAPGVEGVF